MVAGADEEARGSGRVSIEEHLGGPRYNQKAWLQAWLRAINANWVVAKYQAAPEYSEGAIRVYRAVAQALERWRQS